MAALNPMPPVVLDPAHMTTWGQTWLSGGQKFTKAHSTRFAMFIDEAVGDSLAVMLGNIPVSKPGQNDLQPKQKDTVEVGPVRIIGGVRPQNFDVGYRPDGVRIAFDSKTLNDNKSVGKNWQNMVNDLATEATTVHSRFPMAVVGFVVCIPRPCIAPNPRREAAMVGTLTRLGGRVLVDEPEHRAEAMSLVVWDPSTGQVDTNLPDPASPLRIERFHEQMYEAYHGRYQGLPPHAD